mmetsp:Transcript_401/g.803  ORF Transcript_401/g.803 Transcript_401/m.803 type:complete len:189 (-) Transcript_401:92-658(-)|eukprot:CAMPEP_0168739590 /NCGR_PEP_ID=MMETSP0724-20121128/11542_1 /TAXON_ID=265536 /ORGANISM="Amphiprora sp., Strain CCMP467" /LENGTH=188 /DNA_ID=CAMNT_0008786999 /DNA_START=157 /DNA_END=723 /DNA_ORIENTATION=-
MKFLALFAAFAAFLASAKGEMDECADPGTARINSVQLMWMAPDNSCGVETSFTEFQNGLDIINHEAQLISVSTDWDGTSSAIGTNECALCALENDINSGGIGHQHLDCDTHGVRCGWISKACDFGGYRLRRRDLTTAVEQIHLEELYCERLIEKIKDHFLNDENLSKDCQQIYGTGTTFACVAYFFGY